jgi:hypothetical protein
MTYYHAGRESQRLGYGHTVPLRERFVAGSQCDHLLYCLPNHGPGLEDCQLKDGTHIQVLWALPKNTRRWTYGTLRCRSHDKGFRGRGRTSLFAGSEDLGT